MRLVELKSIKGSIFAIMPDNIKEVCSIENYSTISTYDGNCYDCKFSFEHTVTLINNALMEGHQYMTTTHKFPSCARN